MKFADSKYSDFFFLAQCNLHNKSATILQCDTGLAHTSAGKAGVVSFCTPFQDVLLFQPKEWSLRGCSWQVHDTDFGLSCLSFFQQEQYGSKCLISWRGAS